MNGTPDSKPSLAISPSTSELIQSNHILKWPLRWWFLGVGFVFIHSPFAVRKFFATLLGLFFFDVLRFRRRIILGNLTIAFPQMPADERVRLGRQSTIQFCLHFFELFMVPHLTHEWIDRNVEFYNIERYQKVLSQKKGALVLCLHLGHGDLASSVMQARGMPLTIITKFFNTRLMNDIWFSFRGATGVEFIEPHGEKTPFAILKSLRRQLGVIFVIDQFMGKPFGVETKFFGRTTGTAMGLALFALKTRAPVIPIYGVPGPGGKIEIHYEEPFDIEALLTGDKNQDLLVLTQAFNDKIEQIIRKYPDQWMWFHRRWKEFE